MVLVVWAMTVTEKNPNCFVLVVIQGMNWTRRPTLGDGQVRPCCQMFYSLENHSGSQTCFIEGKAEKRENKLSRP